MRTRKSQNPGTGTGDAQTGGTSGQADDLAAIREQTRENGQLLQQNGLLLRQLLELLRPKADGDGPKLDELLALLLVQQRQVLFAVQGLTTEVRTLLDHVAGESQQDLSGNGPNGRAHG